MSEPIPSLEYSAVRNGGAGLIDLSARGRLLVSGSEAVTFLNGLITNDMKTLANTWMPAVFPNVQGRLLAAVRVIHRDDGFLIDTESATRDTVIKLLERFTLAGDFRLANLTQDTALLSIQGAKAGEIMAVIFGETLASPGRNAVASVDWQGKQITVIRATHTAEDGFDLFVNATEAETLRDSFIKAGAPPIDDDTFETLRIEAGIARYGIDMDETNVVTETNLDAAVSFTKGCYIGQEIIARIKYRGHVAKKLAGLIFESKVSPESGAKIFSSDDKEIGRVTSFAFSPHLKRTIALGYVKFDYLAAGTSVRVDSSGTKFVAAVAEFPFIRGSWYTD
ncbi:MAG TPA: glycine cleavage T C-terminal barrel domain-containing protein [Pyrinomonadaceae bacterium]|nr:glycine cleavage T C-terminal barrel domain-containing protein [Pyrinomonadaceae bacterium]